MMILKDLAGKKANAVRWEALKLLDWEKDAEIIERISMVANPRFFSSRTPEDVVDYARKAIEEEKNYEKMYEEYEEWKRARA